MEANKEKNNWNNIVSILHKLIVHYAMVVLEQKTQSTYEKA